MPFTFIDLFAGIGGFHGALRGLGGTCVYSVEIDPAAAAIYKNNWGHDPLGDITLDVNESEVKVPPHDVLVAGFPCQPFSKSGAQRQIFQSAPVVTKNESPASENSMVFHAKMEKSISE